MSDRTPSPLNSQSGGHTAKYVHRTGALNHLQGSGENLMVDTTIADRVRAGLAGQTHRFLSVDRHGRLCVSRDRLADLITDIATTLTHDLTRESDLREQEVIAVTVERDRAEARVAELENRLLSLGAEPVDRHADGQLCWGCQSCLTDDSDEPGGER